MWTCTVLVAVAGGSFTHTPLMSVTGDTTRRGWRASNATSARSRGPSR